MRYSIFFQNINGERRISYLFPGQLIIDYYPQRDKARESTHADDLGRASEFLAENRERFMKAGSLFSGEIGEYEFSQLKKALKARRVLLRDLLNLIEKTGVTLDEVRISARNQRESQANN